MKWDGDRRPPTEIAYAQAPAFSRDRGLASRSRFRSDPTAPWPAGHCGLRRPFKHLRRDLPSGFGGSLGYEIADALDQSSRPFIGQNGALDRGFRERPEDWGRQGQDDDRPQADRQAG